VFLSRDPSPHGTIICPGPVGLQTRIAPFRMAYTRRTWARCAAPITALSAESDDAPASRTRLELPAPAPPRDRGRRALGTAGRAEGRSGRLLPLAEHATTFALGEAPPDTFALAVHNGVLEAHLAHGAARADGLRILGLFVRERVEDLGVEPSARRSLAPRDFHQPITFSRSAFARSSCCRARRIHHDTFEREGPARACMPEVPRGARHQPQRRRTSILPPPAPAVKGALAVDRATRRLPRAVPHCSAVDRTVGL